MCMRSERHSFRVGLHSQRVRMNTATQISAATPNAVARVESLNWQHISEQLDSYGSAVLERILVPRECRAVADLYSEDEIFRSRVVMARHGFGRGEYKYFK